MKTHVSVADLEYCRHFYFSWVQAVRQEGSTIETVGHFHMGTPFWKKNEDLSGLVGLAGRRGLRT